MILYLYVGIEYIGITHIYFIPIYILNFNTVIMPLTRENPKPNKLNFNVSNFNRSSEMKNQGQKSLML